MKRSNIILIIVVIVVVVAGVALWMYYSSQTPVAYNPPANTNAVANTPATVPPVVQPPVNMPSGGGLKTITLNTVKDTKLGTRIVAANGHALYYFTVDAPGVSNCTGVCAVNWPAYTVASNTSLMGGSDITGKISTISKPDGSLQVTYNGAPLYFWHLDATASDTLGQGIGGVWFVQKP
jgi:predicted lipoprotein with Yx(FWY)xxD motif